MIRRGVAVLAGLTTAVALLTAPVTAVADDSAPDPHGSPREFTVGGRVTDDRGTDVEGWVLAYISTAGTGDEDVWTHYRETEIAPDGTYALQLPRGEYRLQFNPLGRWSSEWWRDATDADTATPLVVVDADLLDVDAELSRSASVSGRITLPDGLTPASAVVTAAYDRDFDGHDVVRVETDSTGSYTIPYRRPGDTFLAVRVPGYAPVYWPDAYLPEDAEPVALDPGENRTGVDARAHRGASVSGTTTGPGGPVQSPDLRLYRLRDDAPLRLAARTSSDPGNGRFTFSFVPPGDYLLMHWAPQPSQRRWWRDAAVPREATPLTVEEGDEVDGFDLDLGTPDRSGSLEGMVRPASDVDSAPPVDVLALRETESGWETFGSATTDEEGGFVVADLEPGTYRVQFSFPADGERRTWWWRDAYEVSSATDVAVGTDPIDLGAIRAPAKGGLSGTVLTPSGQPAAQATVGVARLRIVLPDGQREWEDAGVALTDADGHYALSLQPGTYRVTIGGRGLLTQYWDGTPATGPFGGYADPAPGVVVEEGSTRELDVRLSPGAVVTGSVLGGDGGPVPGWVTVLAFNGAEWRHVSGAEIEADGRYVVGELPPGTYRVRATPEQGSAWSTHWWPAASTAAEGDDIVLEHEERAEDVDFVLPRAATVSGRLQVVGQPTADPTPDGYEQPRALLYRRIVGGPWDAGEAVALEPDGSFQFVGLRPGRYIVGFVADGYADSFHGGASLLSEASVITVAEGEDVAGIDGELRPWGSLSGRVERPSGAPADRAAVTAYLAVAEGRWLPVHTVLSDADGAYRIPHLAAGQYRIRVVHRGADEWWYDAASLEESPVVPLSAGQHRTGLDARVGERAVITGTVRSRDGEPASGVDVTAVRIAGAIETSTTTAADGTYALEVPGTGRYRVRVDTVDARSSRPWAEGSSQYPELSVTRGAVYRLDLVRPRLVAFTAQLPPGDPGLHEFAVYAIRDGELLAYPPLDAEIDDGVFSGLLPEGVYRVRLAHGMWWPEAVDASSAGDLVIGPETDTVDLRNLLSPEGARVRNVEPPTISGDPQVGRNLTASPGLWSVPVARFAYRWLADGVVIKDATAPTLTVTPDLYRRHLKVEVRAIAPGLLTTAARSAASAAIGDDVDQPVAVDGPYVTPRAEVGRPLVAVTGTWLPERVTFGYQWVRGRTPIAGATEARYVPTLRDAGERLTVVVIARASGLPDGVAASAPTAPVTVTLTVARRPRLSGKPIVGRTLVARAGDVFRPGVRELRYRWQRDGRLVRGATTARYRLRRVDLGHRIRVVVVGSVPGSRPASVTSRPSAPVRIGR